MSGAEKLRKELEDLIKKAPDMKPQYDLVFGELLKKCEEEPAFDSQVAQEHKSWERCYRFMESKARKMSVNGARSCAVISTTLFQWIYEYYALDDKEEIEKAKKAAAERKAKEEERKKAAEEKKATENKVEKVIKAPDRRVIPVKEEKQKAPDLSGQMDIFSFLGD